MARSQRHPGLVCPHHHHRPRESRLCADASVTEKLQCTPRQSLKHRHLLSPPVSPSPTAKWLAKSPNWFAIRRARCCSTIRPASTTLPPQPANGKVLASIPSCC